MTDELLDDVLPELDGAMDPSNDEPEEEIEEPAAEKILCEIEAAAAKCKIAEKDMQDAAAVHKAAKSAYDATVLRLRQLCGARENDRDRPLFAGLDESDPNYESKLDEPLGSLDLSEAIQAKLVEYGIETIRDLENLRAEISMGKANWPKGIGAAKVTAIENAVTEWLGVFSEEADDEPIADPPY